jgi:4-amino-4-deoxy-L-arabinose transferase-like glycosyltransferase
MNSALSNVLRPGRSGRREVHKDLVWLLGLAFLLIATGIGLRDPWPADEPRFALIARDMVATGEWLLPRVGGDLYADKPPLFFWIVGLLYSVTGSLGVAVLLPGLLASVGVLLLTYDLARRWWNREVAFAAGLGLLATVQFVWQARQGQIDATLCFFTTLGFYGLMRHLLQGPEWRWYVIGWLAAGLGVLTKGVGFLPLLVFLPYAAARARGWVSSPDRQVESLHDARAWLGPLAMLLPLGLWLIALSSAAQGSPEIAAYRDELLFGQTITRYIDAWHHRRSFGYFALQVIPFLWLPLIALTPWLWKRWRESWRRRDLRVLLPLAWVALVVLFFSLSSGKRGVYVLPAAPAFVLACAPFLRELSESRGPRQACFAIACSIAVATCAAAIYAFIASMHRQALSDQYGLDVTGPLLAIGAGAGLACAIARPRNGFAAYGGALLAVLLVVSYWVNPAMNESRSGAAFMRRLESLVPATVELGAVAYKEQYLLHASRPVVNFGHRRWRDFDGEVQDAAAWLAAAPGRVLLVDEHARARCFAESPAIEAGLANRQRWRLVSAPANHDCVARGHPSAAQRYAPPVSRNRRRASDK